MDLFQVIEKRRSVRQFGNQPVPTEAIERSLKMAVLAPNSSNMQTWDFFWIRSPEPKARVAHACLGQSAAVTASDLVVVTCDVSSWRRSQGPIRQFLHQVHAPAPVQRYYARIVPLIYSAGRLQYLFRRAYFAVTGLFRPTVRRPAGRRDIEEIAIKSAALAAENFVLAMTAQGYATCMMEGFDENRIRKILGLGRGYRVAMVIAVGEADTQGIWTPRFRLPFDEVVHRI